MIWLIIIQAIFAILNIVMAKIEATLKNDNISYVIKHGWWMAAYFAMIGIAVFFDRIYWLILLLLLVRAIVFDVAFNIYRRLAPDFTDTSSTAITDKIERYIFGKDFWFEKIVYVVVLIACNFLIGYKVWIF